jgi:Calcineurin-like phosphoesterase/Iron/zinc purple acid phosphatase-like protein C
MRQVILGLIVVLGAAPAGAVTLTRGPYLQLLTTRSVTVVWNTNASASCSLAIHPLGGPTSIVSGAKGVVCAVEVAGLAPGTEYAYTPRADGVALAGETVFHTDDPNRPYSFLVIGDSGTGGSKQRALSERMLATPADFILHTGDMVYEDGAPEDFDPKFFRPYRDLIGRMVLWPTLGNHDVHTAGGAPWRTAFWTPANNPSATENYYSFDAGNAHVVVLNSNASLNPGSAQSIFLDQDLAATTKLWKVIAFHHTIYSGGVHGSSGIRGNVVPLFDRYGVDLVFMGHDHDYERTLPLRDDHVVASGGGTVYVTTGGGGQTIRPVVPTKVTAYAESTFHYVRVAVDGGSLLLQMIRDDGVVGDQTVLSKGGTTPPAPRCGDGLVNQPSEQCDGADRPACTGACTADCRCAPLCGDGLVNQTVEQCDGPDDRACAGLCLSSCTCGSPSQFTILAPLADTHIQSGGEATWDHGAARNLDVDLSPASIAYLKFDLHAVTRPVVGATLTLHSTNTSYDGGTVYPVRDSSWIEGDRTGADASSARGPGLRWVDVDTNADGEIDDRDTSPWVPDLRSPAGSITSLSGADVSVDVTAALAGGGGLRTLVIKNDSTDGAAYSSREDPDLADRPRLRLELGQAGSTTTTTPPPPPPTTSTTTTTLAPASTTTTTTTIPPVTPVAVVLADATVRADALDTNFGTSATLETDAAPAERSFLRIGVSGTAGGPVRSVRLRLQVADVYGAPSDSGGRLRVVASCAWDERTITWATQPAVAGTVIDSAGAVQAGSVVEFDLTPVITGDGVWCFALDTASQNGVIYNSREAAAGAPSLVLEIGAPPTTTTSTTVAPASTTTTTTTIPGGRPLAVILADATVHSDAPGENFGTSAVLEADAAPAERSFLRIGVSGTAGEPVRSVRLRLQVADMYGAPSDSGGRLRVVPSCAWDEGTITWATQPAVAATVLDSAGAVQAGSVVEFDLTRAISGDGFWCFALDTTSQNGVVYNSREAASGAPSVVLEVGPPTTTTSTTTSSSTTSTLPAVGAVIDADVVVSEGAKDTNFGSAPELEIAKKPKTRTFLRARVIGVGARRVRSARLRLQVSTRAGAGSDKGGRFKWIKDCAWSELTATWNNQPDRHGAKDLLSLGSVAVGQTVEIDATQFVDGDGTYCFMVEADSDDSVIYNSREAASGQPTMVLDLAP